MSESGPDRLFDHEFDGIREYDNPLPRWWTTIFALTVVVAFPYVLYYHVGAGPSVHDAYEAEKIAYANRLLATYGELSPDQPTLLRLADDELAMTAMAGLFRGKCATCHLADGSGNVGPNLTDDRWIHVKGITDLHRVISAGVADKGMPAWKDQLTATQVVLLASYVARLAEQPLPGKAPQGEPIGPWATADGP